MKIVKYIFSIVLFGIIFSNNISATGTGNVIVPDDTPPVDNSKTDGGKENKNEDTDKKDEEKSDEDVKGDSEKKIDPIANEYKIDEKAGAVITLDGENSQCKSLVKLQIRLKKDTFGSIFIINSAENVVSDFPIDNKDMIFDGCFIEISGFGIENIEYIKYTGFVSSYFLTKNNLSLDDIGFYIVQKDNKYKYESLIKKGKAKYRGEQGETFEIVFNSLPIEYVLSKKIDDKKEVIEDEKSKINFPYLLGGGVLLLVIIGGVVYMQFKKDQ